jgi:uncharacterized protein YggE
MVALGGALAVATVVGLGIATVGGLVLGGVLPVPSSAAGQVGCGTGTAQLTLQGTGTATGRPNLVTATLQVDESGATAQQALAADDARTASVDSVLGRDGVSARDVQTTDLTLSPQYHYPSGGPPELVGYSVAQTLTVRIHDLASAGTVLDAAVTAGGSALSVSSVTFTGQDPTVLQDQARAAAVKNAVTHAQAMARAAGDHLARLCSVTDDTGAATPTPPSVFAGAAQPDNGVASQVPLSAGTLSASAQVTLVYAVAPLH